MVSPSASIVIVNYNGAAFIEPTIVTALAQQCRREVIVVDNASTDDSLQVLRAMAGVRVIASERNTGFAGGANLGASAGLGDYIAFLNSDALADPDWLARMLPWMDAARVDLASSVVTSFGQVWFGGGTWVPALAASLTTAAPPLRPAWLSGCALVVRRSAWEALGGFDERFFLYFEDVDVCLRARAAGYRVAMHPQPLVRHDVPGRTADTLGFEKMRIAYRSKGRLAAKHVPRFWWPLAVPFQCVVSPLAQGVPAKRLPDIRSAFFEGIRAAQ